MKPEITSRSFDGVEFEFTRIDHNQTGYDDLPKQMAARFGSGAAENLPLDPDLAELVRLLVSINNRCSYCSILHTFQAQDQKIMAAKIAALPAWREAQLYTDAEVAALTYTEALSGMDQGEIQAAHELLEAHFDEAQIESLVMVIVNMEVFTRIFLAQGRQPRQAKPE